ncbi:MAG: SDR family oxidoreductase [Roseiarcus sp.]|jgi:NAD(P)-dependent dehydrogenase (short-subunit alcohol dehydrogenase family)
MEIRVGEKILVVTGATQGLGRAVALEAAKSGAAGVMLTGRNETRGAEVVGELKGLGIDAAFVSAELADPEMPAKIMSTALDRFGRIDALVNAAALSDRGSIADADVAFFDRLFAVNTRAPMFLMQGLIRHLKERKASGSIVNILSVNAHGGAPDLAVYAATKAAMALLTKNAAYSHRFDRIRVNGINLGWTDTPGERSMQAVKLGKGEDWLAQAEARMPWGRLIKPEDVARLTLFLLSDASIPMTGALIDQAQNSVLGVRD